MTRSTRALRPFYLAVQCSAAASPHLPELGSTLDDLLSKIERESASGQLVRLTLLAWSDSARLLLDMVDPREVEGWPTFNAAGPNLFAPLFAFLVSLLEQDTARFEATGESVERPVVGMVVFSVPVDEAAAWRPALAALRAHRSKPKVVAVGFDRAADRVLREIAEGGSLENW